MYASIVYAVHMVIFVKGDSYFPSMPHMIRYFLCGALLVCREMPSWMLLFCILFHSAFVYVFYYRHWFSKVEKHRILNISATPCFFSGIRACVYTKLLCCCFFSVFAVHLIHICTTEWVCHVHCAQIHWKMVGIHIRVAEMCMDKALNAWILWWWGDSGSWYCHSTLLLLLL